MGGSHRLSMALHAPRSATVGAVYQQTQRWLRAGVFEEMVHDLRLLLRLTVGRASDPTATILDSRTLRSTPHSGSRGGYDAAKRKKGSKVHAAVDTLGHLLALRVSPANEQEREDVGEMALAVEEAEAFGLRLEVVKHEEANRGFALLPRGGGSWRGISHGIAHSAVGEGL